MRNIEKLEEKIKQLEFKFTGFEKIVYEIEEKIWILQNPPKFKSKDKVCIRNEKDKTFIVITNEVYVYTDSDYKIYRNNEYKLYNEDKNYICTVSEYRLYLKDDV
jgi:hypothetical protein